MTDFYKIGQVIEVRGQKLRIRVFENKNSNILIYNGQIIKNVSVGGFEQVLSPNVAPCNTYKIIFSL